MFSPVPEPSPIKRFWKPTRIASTTLLAAAGLAVLATLWPQLSIGQPKNPHGDFKEDCGLCHDASGWKPAKMSPKFDHARFGFPLDGTHAAADCRSCHASLEFSEERSQCVSCHQDVHRGELGVDCARCHTAHSFIDRSAMVRAHQLTRFPLTGYHASLDCETCHPPAASGHMQFVGTEAQCYDCHQQDFQLAKEPDHLGAGFSHDCQHCHGPIQWAPARFDHDRTSFPLTGAHRTALCEKCHGDGVYRGKSTACASCHQAEYDATTNPPHAGVGFPLDCQNCHGTGRWEGAQFDHDGPYFPIYSGAHAGRWTECATCHVNPNNYTQFDCLSCHPHSDKTATDGHHSQIAGYSYDSQSCYSCHPQGTH